jgi:hypothetical protein
LPVAWGFRNAPHTFLNNDSVLRRQTETIPLCADEVINLLIIWFAPVNILAAMVSQLESKGDLKISLKRPFLSQKHEDPS